MSNPDKKTEPDDGMDLNEIVRNYDGDGFTSPPVVSANPAENRAGGPEGFGQKGIKSMPPEVKKAPRPRFELGSQARQACMMTTTLPGHLGWEI